MTAEWLPVLAGGVGGGVLTNLWGEWRQWRADRREDRQRFDADRLELAGELLRLAGDAHRLQGRRLALTRHSPPADADEVAEIDRSYRSIASDIGSASARFRLLYPASSREALEQLTDALDHLTLSVTQNREVRGSLVEVQNALESFSANCRTYLNGRADS